MNWQSFVANGAVADWVLLTALHSLWFSIVAVMIVKVPKLRAPAVRSAWCTFSIILLLALPLITCLVPRSVLPAHAVQAARTATISTVLDIDVPLLNNFLGVKKVAPEPNAEQWKMGINELGMLWLAVTLGCVGRLLYGLAFLRGYCNCLREVADGRLPIVLRDITETFDFRRKPRFFVSLTLPSPVSIGISKPMVILPAGLYQSAGDDELRAILIHELAHIHNSDHVLGLLGRLVKALYWWNPFVYRICDTLTAAREEVSDNYAISAMGSAASYAALLVRLIEDAPLISRMPCVTGMAAPYQCLQTRIWNIVSKKRDLRVKAGKGMISAILATAVFMCCLVGLGSQVNIFGTELAVASEDKPMEAPIKTRQPDIKVDSPHSIVDAHRRSQSSSTSHESAKRTQAAIAPLPGQAAVPYVRTTNFARSDSFPTLRNEKSDAPQTTPIRLDGSNPPIVRFKVEPEYPDAAKSEKIAGTVQIAVVVNEKGDVYEGKVAMGHPFLHKPALNAALQWKFVPKSVDEVPRAFVTIVEFHFRY
jgi:TonB family protein